MYFCQANSSLSFWDHKGFPVCFYSLIASSVPFGFIFLFGLMQIWFYGKYSHHIEKEYKHRSALFYIQILLSFTMMLEPLFRFAFETTVIDKNKFYISLILNCTFSFIMWIVSLILLAIERHKALPSIPSRGHGLILLIFWTIVLAMENLAIVSWKSSEWFWRLKSQTDYIRFGLWMFRYIAAVSLFFLGLKAPGVPKRRYGLSINADAESRPQNQTTWKGFFKKIRAIGGFLWPRNSCILQINALFCISLLVLTRVTGLLMPIYSKLIVDELSATPNSTQSSFEAFALGVVRPDTWPWKLISVLVLLRFLQGGGTGVSGLFNNLRTTLWVKIEQYTSLSIATKLFSHLHGLSLKWHLSRKTGEILRIVSRGTDSVNNLTTYLLFNIIPTFVDVIIAIVYFVVAFNMWFGIIMFMSVVFYLGFTILITEWRSKFRRELITFDNAINARAVDSLINFETVKYFGNEKYELEKYKEQILKYQKVEWVSEWSLWLLNFTQNVIISSGLLIGSLYCVWLVSAKEGLSVGDYVLYTTYVLQLYAPLNFLGSYYRAIQQSFIDMEAMFNLFDEEQDIKDEPGALPLIVSDGKVEFENVSFGYSNERICLKNVSFTVQPGHTVAIVGPSGAGKSTIIRLLFRFYEANEGRIKIDSQNIKHITQESLRRTLGVVPQDTVLFNNDIKYNIRYGRTDASDEEVENAAIAADLHNSILRFEKGYDTVVGERGLKLSGGEKQRVAIARTILKAPKIVLLDEATSALDTKTERNIQTSLSKVSENRTTIVIAHRLSTIINANQILVLKDGEVVERGTHNELLSLNDGVYASMWNQQLQAINEGESSGGKTAEDDGDEKLIDVL